MGIPAGREYIAISQFYWGKGKTPPVRDDSAKTPRRFYREEENGHGVGTVRHLGRWRR